MGGQPGALTLSEDDRRVLAVWAADCAERTLSLFQAGSDRHPPPCRHRRPASLRPWRDADRRGPRPGGPGARGGSGGRRPGRRRPRGPVAAWPCLADRSGDPAAITAPDPPHGDAREADQRHAHEAHRGRMTLVPRFKVRCSEPRWWAGAGHDGGRGAGCIRVAAPGRLRRRLRFIAAYLGVLVLVGVLGRAAGLLPGRVTTPGGRIMGQLAAFAVLTVPVTLWFAGWEAAPHGATPGKRLLGLRVSRLDGGAPSRPRALLRSLARIAVPWELAHTGVWNILVWPGPEAPVTTALDAVRRCPPPPLRPPGRHGRAGRPGSPAPWRHSAHDW